MSTAAVITCSTRSAAGERGDDSGPLLADLLVAAGHRLVHREVVPDDVEEIRAALRRALDAGARVVLTTGGTGLTPRDVTPEAVTPLLERQVPGIAEALRQANRERIPTSVLSRGVAGVIGAALVVTLPGSPGGVRDGMAVLVPLLDHAVEQLGGGDHRLGGGVCELASERGSLVAVSAEPLDVAMHERLVATPEAGAHVVFCGIVRDNDHGREVVSLDYVGHPTAEQVLAEVVAGFAADPDVLGLAVSHRVGTLAIGDVALVAAVATCHRGEAFDICRRLVDEVKHRVPIWKRQVFADGTDEWVNCP